MKYESFEFSSKSEVEAMLSSNDQELKIAALVGMINGIDDRTWVEGVLIQHVTNDDFWIAKNAITGLGDLARIYGRLDMIRVRDSFKKVKHRNLKVVIEETLKDVETFI